MLGLAGAPAASIIVTPDMARIFSWTFCCDHVAGEAKEIKSRASVKTVLILIPDYHLEVGTTAYTNAAWLPQKPVSFTPGFSPVPEVFTREPFQRFCSASNGNR
jgi:hypothetical protein